MSDSLATAFTFLSSVGLVACLMRWLVANFEPDNPANTVARDGVGAVIVVASTYAATRLDVGVPFAPSLLPFVVAACVFRYAFGFSLGLALLSSFLLSIVALLLAFGITVLLVVLARAHLALAAAAAVVLAGAPAVILARAARAAAERARRRVVYPPPAV